MKYFKNNNKFIMRLDTHMLKHARKTFVCLAILLLCLASAICFSSCAENKIHLKTIIIPKIEADTFDDDTIGEAQFIYKDLMGSPKEFTISSGKTLYVNGDTAMFIAGQGKTNSATHLTSLLSDTRFNCSQAYIISVGCAGGASGQATFGDVSLATATVDLDLGHTADYRDLQDKNSEKTFFFDKTLNGLGCKKLNGNNVDIVYNKAKSLELKTSASTKNYANLVMPGETWAHRDPKVLKGTHVTADNYWKGKYYEANANYVTSQYGCADPFTATEMEDYAIAQVADYFGMLDRVFAVRGIVNPDLFPSGATPESLWGSSDYTFPDGFDEMFIETMRNIADVVNVIVELAHDGSLG